jgi:hypothetical protein
MNLFKCGVILARIISRGPAFETGDSDFWPSSARLGSREEDVFWLA